MPTLRDALSQIADIRQHLAETRVFRGYRASAALGTSLIAVTAAFWQAFWIDDPVARFDDYLLVWFVAAVAGLAMTCGRVLIYRRRGDETNSIELGPVELRHAALQQLAPSIVAGLLVTLAIVMFHGSMVALLPGLWMILFSMGVFASRRLLPGAVVIVGAHYLLAGLVVLTLSPFDAMRPWVMGGVFGAGQLLAAIVLYWTLERNER
jgi:hypothetical protein